jgi:hypothetical protein
MKTMIVLAAIGLYMYISKPHWKIQAYCRIQAAASELEYGGYDFVQNRFGAVRDISCHFISRK